MENQELLQQIEQMFERQVNKILLVLEERRIEHLLERQVNKILMVLEERQIKQKKEIEKFFSVEEVAEYIGFKKASIYGLINRKSIPHIKCGRLLKFEKSQIDLWLQSKRKKTGEEIQSEANRYIRNKRSF